ncbi:MAG: exodeoxyribonuclease VII small subunit [bacterium]
MNEFEYALKRLEEIVKELERGERSLEESLKLFEEGIQMSRICTERLTAAKEKLQQLVRSEDGTFKIAPLEGEDL